MSLNISNFYLLYPNFDIFLYKLLYKNNLFKKNIEYMENYINQNKKNIYEISNLNEYIKKYDVDFYFIKKFYNSFIDKTNYKIIEILNNDINDYILSNDDFIKKFKDFNIDIYKIFNNLQLFNSEIEYKSFWFHYGQNNHISTIDDIYNKYSDLNINFYKSLYSIKEKDEIKILIEWYKNKDKVIYSLDTFLDKIDDFNYDLFKKNYNIINDDKNEIILYYINNIDKINDIYSEKLFYLTNKNFNILEYKKLNKINNNNNLHVINNYLKNKKNKKIITSIDDFYIQYPSFNILFYKSILKFKNIILNNNNDYIFYMYTTKDTSIIYSIDMFYKLYPDFNLFIYKIFNDIHLKYDYEIIAYFYCNYNDKIIYSLKTFYNNYQDFDKEIYTIFNQLESYNEYELIIHFYKIGLLQNLIYHSDKIINNNNFNLNIYRELNKDIKNLNSKELICHWYNKGKFEDRIYSIETFYKKYEIHRNSINNIDHIDNEEEKIIYWMNKGYYDYLKSKNNDIIGRNEVNNIYEVFIDLENINLNYLEKGISLIIRAKNEELNIKNCIESVVDLVDEIIFVDNNSTDNTYSLVQEYSKKYKNIKLYKYNIHVSKVGIEHQNAILNNNKNTLGTFYNWCLSKATKYNVIKWDADFICIRNNFIQLVELYNLKNRNDMFALWFTGKTLFENNNTFYINYESFYNEYRIFSYKNGFKWYDGNTCEYTDPYIHKCNIKYKYEYPLFYEVKRTSINEFEERSSLIDQRDINDYNILNNLKNKDTIDLIKINPSFNKNKIIFYTPSLNWGGGNQFIINMYIILKNIGYEIFIFPLNNSNYNEKFNPIIKNDIYHSDQFTIDFIIKHQPQFILFNSSIPFHKNDINIINKYSKIIFVTHSDVAFSNSFIQKYYNDFYKIITVNQYTIDKLTKLLNINNDKFYKIINYLNINDLPNDSKKKYNFGVLSRFSEDKNIPMFILSLLNIFNKYPNYTCYLVGSNNESYDNYLMHLIKINNLDVYIKFVGYQNDTSIYYKKFDFIILPSVSEGCSYNILEAMSYGLPVITSNVGGNHELINDTRGLLYDYTELRNFESKKIYIENYNEQLSLIGYVEKDKLNNNINYKFMNHYNEELLIPFYLSCKIHINYDNKCNHCIYIKNKIELFNINKERIEKSILSMIEKNEYVGNKNIEFIKTHFHKNIYINQIFSIFL